jgi:ribose transport system substrate-binding protein
MNNPSRTVSRRGSLRLAGAAALAALAGCHRPSEAGGRQFAVSFQTMNNPFFVELNDGLKAAVEARGGRLLTLDARHDSHKQRNDLSDALQQRPAALFLNPVNWEGVRGSLVEAKRAGVPVIVVDTPVGDAELVLAQVASDNVAAGRLAAEALGRVKPAAKVAILHHSVAKSCIDRVAGFREAAAKFPGMTILQTEEGKGTTEGSRPVMVDLLGRFPELDAVFAINDPSAIGCASAVESTPGRAGTVAIVTVDGSREGIEAVKAGRLLATVAQSPSEIGRLAAGLAFDHLEGKPVPKDVKVPVRLVTRETADVAR